MTDRRAPSGFGPLAIGLCLTLIHLVSIPVTNTSVNPARSTGPALFVGGDALSQLWLFWLAPVVGAALAGVAYRFLTGERGIGAVATEGQETAGAEVSIGEVDTLAGDRGRGELDPSWRADRPDEPAR